MPFEENPVESIKPLQWRRKIGIHGIGFYKFCKGLLFIALAIGLFTISKTDPADLGDKLISYLHIDPETPLWIYLVDRMDELTATKIELFAYGFTLLAILDFAQAFGLMFQRQWAAIMVILEAFVFIPFEVYELHRRITIKICVVLLVNILIAVYLLKHWFLFSPPDSRLNAAKKSA